MSTIDPGSRVLATSASGEQLERRAITGPVDGDDFRVVWVCREEEWVAALNEGRDPEGIPWPVEDVQVAAEVTVA
jgi:hypothetical protein